MKRIHLHWTAGGYTPSPDDLDHYHFIVAGDGRVVQGRHPVEANRAPITGAYAAHTRNANSDAIGIALAAMFGALHRPFSFGMWPILPVQLAAFVQLAADLARAHGIPVRRETILTHAEVQPTLGIPQSGKWDITWLPGMIAPGDPVAVGDVLRAQISAALEGEMPVALPPTIRRGDLGPPVARLQTALHSAGYPPGAIDAQFGKRTDAALRLFQRARGLRVDGICGPATWADILKSA